MRVVVTGGAGFIGCNVTRALLRTLPSCEVVIVDDLSTGRLSNLADVFDQIEFREVSILDDAAWLGLADVDAVVHLAALPSVPRSVADPLTSNRVNVDGTLSVLEFARRQASPPQVIVASSSSVYGGNTAAVKQEEMFVAPLSPYACSKLATEAYTLAYQRSYGLDTLAFRFFNVYGPYQHADNAYAAVIPLFIAAAMEGRPMTLQGDGSQTRDFTFVDDVASTIVDAVVRRVVSPRPVNLAFGGNTSVKVIGELIAAECGIEPSFTIAPPRVGDVPHSCAESSRVRELFPSISPRDLAAGIASTVRWASAMVLHN